MVLKQNVKHAGFVEESKSKKRMSMMIAGKNKKKRTPRRKRIKEVQESQEADDDYEKEE